MLGALVWLSNLVHLFVHLSAFVCVLRTRARACVCVHVCVGLSLNVWVGLYAFPSQL